MKTIISLLIAFIFSFEASSQISSVSFENGALPSGWTLSSTNDGGITNNRLEAYPTDGSAWIQHSLSGSNKIVVKYRGHYIRNRWGSFTRVAFGKSGVGSKNFIAEHGVKEFFYRSSTFARILGASDQPGNELALELLPVGSGTYDYVLVIEKGKITYSGSGNGPSFEVVYESPDIEPKEMDYVRVRAHHTVDAGPTWVDDVEVNIASEVGEVSWVRPDGNAHVFRNGKLTRLKKGSKIQEGDLLLTGKESALRMIFIDDTSVTLGADTSFTIEEFSFERDNSTGLDVGKAIFFLLKGAFREWVTGRLPKGQTKIRTITTAGSIRGTEFSMEVEHVEGEEGNLEEKVSINLVEGEVSLRSVATDEEIIITPENPEGSFLSEISSHNLTINDPGLGGSIFLNGQAIENFDQPILLAEGTSLVIEAYRSPGYLFRGWESPFSNSENVLNLDLDQDISLSATFELFDTSSISYSQLWEETSIPEDQRGVSADANNDGLQNGLVYSLGISPLVELTVEERERLPKLMVEAQRKIGQIQFLLPQIHSRNVRYVIEKQINLGDGPWITLAERNQDGVWLGDATVNLGEEVSGAVPVIIENTETFLSEPKSFMRLRVQFEPEESVE